MFFCASLLIDIVILVNTIHLFFIDFPPEHDVQGVYTGFYKSTMNSNQLLNDANIQSKPFFHPKNRQQEKYGPK